MISRLIATNVSKLQNNYGKTLELNFELNRSHGQHAAFSQVREIWTLYGWLQVVATNFSRVFCLLC